jgi:MHS family proline/betaine transporter-like MFS transporter
MLSDKYGRKPVMMTAAAMVFCIIYPLFTVLVPGASLLQVGLAQAMLCFILGFYLGPVAAVLVELFPTSVRYTGMAIAYNLAAAIFGGTAPFVCEWLIRATGSIPSVAFYVMFCNVVSLIALYYYKDRYKEALR